MVCIQDVFSDDCMICHAHVSATLAGLHSPANTQKNRNTKSKKNIDTPIKGNQGDLDENK